MKVVRTPNNPGMESFKPEKSSNNPCCFYSRVHPPPRGWTVNNNSLIISKLDRCKYLSKIIQMHHREKKHNHTNNSNNNNNNE